VWYTVRAAGRLWGGPLSVDEVNLGWSPTRYGKFEAVGGRGAFPSIDILGAAVAAPVGIRSIVAFLYELPHLQFPTPYAAEVR